MALHLAATVCHLAETSGLEVGFPYRLVAAVAPCSVFAAMVCRLAWVVVQASQTESVVAVFLQRFGVASETAAGWLLLPVEPDSMALDFELNAGSETVEPLYSGVAPGSFDSVDQISDPIVPDAVSHQDR